MNPFHFSIVILFLILGACAPLKPYEKEYLLDPTMDDQANTKLESISATLIQGKSERLGLGLNLGGGTSCPTCGG